MPTATCRPLTGLAEAAPVADRFAALVAFALALPGAVAMYDRRGRVAAIALRDGDALGPADAFFENGSFLRRDPARGDSLEVILPEALWRRAVMTRLARVTWTTDLHATSRATRLDPPADPMGRRALEDLIEGAWAYARGL
ncbi:MAG TPA: hypothetical protein VEA41_05905 [Salinarimonas sp.]|jgi:hypothetical protein|nr:hypothetical protein [Salinarimonas sp.]